VPTLVPPHKLTPEDAWRPTLTERDECRECLKALRAFDIETGQELWKELLLASAQATPMTCRLGGTWYRRGEHHTLIVPLRQGLAKRLDGQVVNRPLVKYLTDIHR
jgi:hypothetical protein